ncbi:hypothetical protein [Maricaulis maris]|uniref:Uncharacterized protein n=1 Tax=Maricaulis maris TaxID=74318 RepID=A0A495DE34_9PROT|nr:hypothetical protein [Maricaulis maris]RKR00523.1 hypothetical protein C7435_1731 [Maricaulis maris]
MSDNPGIPLPVRIATLGLACLPMLYMGLWSAMIIGSFSGLWHPKLGDLDIGTAILRSDPIEIIGFAAMSVCWLAGLVCLVLNRRAAILALGLACLIHLVVWLKITDGQYYSGQFGLIVILIEMLAITLAHFTTRGRRLI